MAALGINTVRVYTPPRATCSTKRRATACA